MSNENISYERARIMLADNLLADIINEKLSYSNAHLKLYEITKDKYNLREAENHGEQVEVLIKARKVLLQTLKKGVDSE